LKSDGARKNWLKKRKGNNTKNIDFATCFLWYSHSEVKICDFTSYFLTTLKLCNQAVCTNHSYVVNQHLRTDKICFIIRITWTNKMHDFLLIYFNSKPLHVSSRFAAHHEEDHSFIPLARAEFDDSLPFSGASCVMLTISIAVYTEMNLLMMSSKLARNM